MKIYRDMNGLWYRIWLIIGVLLSVCVSANTQAAVWNVTYPRPINENDLRHEYPVKVLQLALEKTGVRYKLSISDRIILGDKAVRQLRENREINVVWQMTDLQREEELLPIRIPIAKGLIGLRVFLIDQSNQPKFNDIVSYQSLLQMTAVQGRDWPDTKILRANGFNVEPIAKFNDGFELLSQRQADFYPRSVIEVENELGIQGLDKSIVLEPNFALYYPTAMYFFVNKSNPTMAKLIETGLKMAVEDGSYEALFQATYAETLERLNIAERQIFRLENPQLSQETPIEVDKYWFVPKGTN